MDQLGLEASEVKPGTSFVDDLGADSLDLVEVVMRLDAVDYIRRHAKSVQQ